MCDKPSLDELFLKASALQGRRQSAFLNAQPASIRKQLRQLLAADASVEKRGFLNSPLHEPEPDATSSAQQKKPETTPERSSVPKSPQSDTTKTGAKTTNSKPRSGPPSSTAAKRRPRRQQIVRAAKRSRRGSVAKSKFQRRQKAVSGQWLTIVCGIAGCVVFGGLIVGALKFRQSLSGETTAVAVQDDSFAKQTPPPAIVTSDPEPTPETREPEPPEPTVNAAPAFYTAAVNAPPLSRRQLEALPTSIGRLAPVTNPLPLPGVRAWTFETIGYKERTFPAMSVDGKFVALGGAEGNIRIANLQTGGFERLIVMPAGIGKTAWLADGKTLLTHCAGKNLLVTIRTGQIRPVLPPVGRGWALTNDGKQLYWPSREDKKLRVYSVADWSVVEEIDYASDHSTIQLSPNGQYLATRRDNTIDVYENTRPLNKLIRVTRPALLTSHVLSDNALLATGWNDGKMAVYDAQSSDTKPISESLVYPKRYQHVRCQAWLNEDVVLMTGTDETIDHYSVGKNRIVATYRNRGWEAPLTYSRSHRKGVICGQTADLLIDGKPHQRVLEGETRLMNSMTFNSDGSQLLTAGFHATRYNLATGTRTGLLGEVEGGPWYSGVSVSNRDWLLCILTGRFDVFPSQPATRSSMIRFDFTPDVVHRANWVENGTSALAIVSRGSVMHCRLSDSTMTPLVVPNNEVIRNVAWDEQNQVAVLLGTEHLFEWNPATSLVQEMRDLPEGCRRELEINPSCTHIAIAGEKIAILTTKDYQTVIEPDWKRPTIKWVSDNELFGVTNGGRQLEKINLTDPAATSTVPIPLEGYKGRDALTFSNTAPVGAALTKGNQVRFFDTRNGAHLGSIILFGAHDYATFTPEGRIVGSSDGFQKKIVYQIQTDQGQETLTPEQFFRRFGKHFKNP